MKCQAGWITNWNQDFWEKYQQPQICRWYHSNDRKSRETKEPLDEDEKGEWKSWLETQHSKKENHGIWSQLFMVNRRVKNWKEWHILFSWAPKSLWMVTEALKLKYLGREVNPNLDSTLKSRDITVWAKVCTVKAMVLLVVTNGCENWTIKKAKGWSNTFQFWC